VPDDAPQNDAPQNELLAMIDPTNKQSKRVAAKIGFQFWRLATVHGYLDEIHRIETVKPTHAEFRPR